MLPAGLRTEVGNTLYITQGLDHCLWAFTAEQWKKISGEIIRSTSIFQANARVLMRRIIAPAQETEIDKTGRINISPALRTYASLSKECTILNMNTYIEIWDKAIYDKYMEASEDVFQSAAEDLGKLISM